MVQIYADGACRGNQNKTNVGAYAFVAVYQGEEIHHFKSGVIRDTTNNKMELQAAIDALGWAFTQTYDPVEVYLDSEYVYKGITEWIGGWKKRDWKTSTREPVKNKELWIKLDEIRRHLKVNWKWVKGHAGSRWNCRADELCNEVLDEL